MTYTERECALELSSIAIGGRIVDVSDEFFAEAKNLLSVGVSLYRVSDLV